MARVKRQVKRRRNHLRRFFRLKSHRRFSSTENLLSDQFEPFEQKNLPIGHIKNLSNEIFYEIFGYLDAYDAHKAFSNLTTHFDLLLHSKPSSLININSVEKPIVDLYRTFIKSNKDDILSFKCNENYAVEFITSYVLDTASSRLESITLDEISPSNLSDCLLLLRTLPQLFSLSIRLEEDYHCLDHICQTLFRFPVLKYLKLQMIKKQGVAITVPVAALGQWSPIERLVIQCLCTLNGLVNLLSYTPQITHVSCRNIVESNESLKIEALMKITNLVHLSLGIVDLDFDHLEEFFVHVCSSLKSLKLSIQSSDKSHLDGDQWERIISQHIPSIKKFVFSYQDSIYEICPWR